MRCFLISQRTNKDIENIQKDGTSISESTTQIKRTNDNSTHWGLKPDVQKNKGRKTIISLPKPIVAQRKKVKHIVARL